MEYLTFPAMNTEIVLGGDGDPIILSEGFTQVRRYIQNCERRFTRFSPDSELSQLNDHTGDWWTVSPDLFELVSAAHGYLDETGGLFDPSILDALQQAGYDRSMDQIQFQGPGKKDLDWEWKRPDFRMTLFDQERSRIRLPHGVRIDLGGIAKGWITEQAAHLLTMWTNTSVVNAGGDLFTIGRPEEDGLWHVALEDPRRPETTIAVLHTQPGAIATSSIVKRAWDQNGHKRHHLIDPRTGEPAQTQWLSMTVIASHAIDAEVYAKAMLIAGQKEAECLYKEHPDIRYIGVREDGTLWGSKNSLEVMDVQPITD